MKTNQANRPIPIPRLKRINDIVVSLFLLTLFSPLFLLIVVVQFIEGLFIQQNRGPIFYTELRISQGKPFLLRKFRIFKPTVYESIRAHGKLVHTKALERDKSNLTYLGHILKACYMDEAPQLWSVLNGDMSMVGPRPWNIEDYENEVANGELRKKVIKAGLTGPVQLHKLDAKKYGGEYHLDHAYIDFVKNHSGIRVVLHDYAILWHSAWFMVKAQGL